MAKTYEPISTTTLGSAAASVTLSSIPNAYTDLVLVVQNASTVEDAVRLQYNGDTGSNYGHTQLGADSGGTFSTRGTSQTSLFNGYSSTGQNIHITHIMNYSNATTYKTSLVRSNKIAGDVRAITHMWRSTAAITSITVIQNAGSFSSGSTFTLYGIKAA